MTDKPLKILVIDDDELDQMIVKRALKSSGIDVDVSFAEDIESGKEATKGQDYDCIFLDYNLPDGSGIELLQAIRYSGNTSPIIIVTSHGDEKIAVEVMKKGASDYIQKSLITPDGVAQSLRYVLRLKKSEQEKIRIENELAQTQRQLETVVKNSPVILFAIDSKGMFTLFEGKGADDLGADKNIIIGKSIQSYTKLFPNVIEIFERTMKGEEVSTILELGGKFYQTFYIPVRDKENKITGVIGTSSDITDHKRAEAELQKAKKLAEDMACIKEQFLANMSHEIRTPMNGIIGLTHILLNTKLEKEQMDYLKSIKISSDNLLVIINDILDFSKIEAGKMNFEKTPFDIREIAQHCKDLFKAKADEKKLNLITTIDKEVPEMLSGDPTRLSQILNNLVGNAIKFTNQGDVQMKIAVRSSREKNVTLDIEVKDSGIGIPKESIGSIFESFTQASNDTTRKFGGTGLGLTIVKRLIELQGGTIGVKSTLGEGTTFFFHLTYEISAEESGKKKEKSVEENQSLSHIKILVAEDNAINQMIVKKILMDWKATVECADNGLIATEKLQAGNFDLVLMDIQMPVMDGYTAVQKIRNDLAEPFRSVPIMAMTAHAIPTEKQKCFDLGMNDYISKPFDPAELKKKIIDLTGTANKPQTELTGNNQVTPEATKTKTESMINENNISNNATEDDDRTSLQKKNLTVENPRVPMETNTSDAKINLTYLKQISDGNDSFIIEMIEMFLKKTPEALEEMDACFKKQNWDELRQIAHRIKPSYGYIGMPDMQKMLAEIESCSNSKTNLEKIPEMISQVQQTSKSIFIDLEKELSNLK